MIIIHVMNSEYVPRLLTTRLRESLAIMPAVVVTGARQTGKSTLVDALLGEDRDYYSLDDLDIRDLASTDPDALLRSERPITVDEIQRVPELLIGVKRAIDEERRPGRFLLTGSANLRLMRDVSESLAGRAAYVNLHPLTRGEQAGGGGCGIWDRLLETPEPDWPDVLAAQRQQQEDWRSLARRGGFPTPALHLEDRDARRIWFDGYIQTYLERDLRDLSAVQSLADFRRLMRVACHRLGQVVNQSELGRDAGLPQPTVHRYMNLLETSFMLVRLPVYAVNRTKRLIKSPKLYWCDTGVALHMAEMDEPSGAHLENMILTDLLAWRDASQAAIQILYWRTTSGDEVDFVVEAGDRLLPIEVKASAKVTVSDTNHLRTFRREYGSKSLAGLVLYGGSTVKWVIPGVLAVPWWTVI